MRTILVVLILVLAGALGAPAQTPPSGYGGSVFVGTRGMDNDNYLGRVSEYDTARQGLRPSVGADWWGQTSKLFLEFRGEHRGDARNQQYSFSLDANRYFRMRTFYDRFVQRRDHDPLADLDVAKGTVVVRSDDLGAGAEYVPGRSEVRTEITGVIPGLPFLTWHAGHRSQLQHGDVQARTIAKCSNCHVTGVTKRIDQRLHDVSGGFTLRASRLTVDYTYLNRQFNERGLTPTLQYDEAVQPATLQKIFGNRVSFDSAQGQLAFSQVPDLRKSMHELKARLDLPGEARLSAALMSSHAENKFTGLGTDAWGWNSKFSLPLGKRLTFVARARKLELDSDDVYLDFGETVSPEGPQAGRTFAQAYPTFGSVDYLRRSVISRSQISTGAELGARLARFTTVRAGYEFSQVKRDHYEVERTERNRVFASFSTRRMGKGSHHWSGRLRYVLENTRDPFAYRQAALSPVMQPFASPGSPSPSPLGGLQYFTMYAARQAHLTNVPNWSHAVEPSWTWMPSDRVSLSMHYRFRTEKNDTLNFSDWDRDSHMTGAELWIAPQSKLNFTFAYAFQNERSRSLFVLPAFDG